MQLYFGPVDERADKTASTGGSWGAVIGTDLATSPTSTVALSARPDTRYLLRPGDLLAVRSTQVIAEVNCTNVRPEEVQPISEHQTIRSGALEQNTIYHFCVGNLSEVPACARPAVAQLPPPLPAPPRLPRRYAPPPARPAPTRSTRPARSQVGRAPPSGSGGVWREGFVWQRLVTLGSTWLLNQGNGIYAHQTLALRATATARDDLPAATRSGVISMEPVGLPMRLELRGPSTGSSEVVGVIAWSLRWAAGGGGRWAV